MKSKSTIDLTRLGGQNQRDAVSQQNREANRKFPVLVGEVGALRQGLQQRPAPVPREVGLQHGWKPLDKGTSFFTTGYSDQTEPPDQFECSEQTEVPSDKKTGNSKQVEKPAQLECPEQTEESTEKDGVFSFHTKQVDALMHVRMDYHFTQRILHLQLYAFLILVAQEVWDLEKQLMHFADMLTHIPTVVSGMKFNRRVQDVSLQTLNNPSALRRLIVLFMYDLGWNCQFTAFDIVEEGDVPLLMSLPQMRNLGFQFEPTPDKAYLSCARFRMRKTVLKTAISTHLILDLQDVAWYLTQVHFKTPQVKSFFSQHDHFEIQSDCCSTR